LLDVVVKKNRLAAVKSGGRFLLSPLQRGKAKEDKNVTVFKNDKAVSARIEKTPNRCRGIIVVSHSTQTDFGRAVQFHK
jgi:hypothetical protein